MKRWLRLATGVLVAIIGVVWTLQGLGYLGGSPMTGVRTWAIIGPILIVAGVVLVGVAFRPGRRGFSRPGPHDEHGSS
jgi:uncharacterized membrane protein HdeD (DUF308 family)